MGLFKNILGLKNDYEWLFFKNEFVELVGDKYNRLSRLVIILLVTFLALSYAKGSYNYLNKKMNNPFTNWVSIPIETPAHKHKRDRIKRFFESPDNKLTYGLADLSGYSNSEDFFYAKNDTVAVDQLGRTIKPESKLLKKILNESNLVWSKVDSQTDSFKISHIFYYDIIVNEDFLKKLAYQADEKLFKVRCQFTENETDIWLNILAVVKQLPNNATFLCFPNLYNALDGVNKSFIDEEEGIQFQMVSAEADKVILTDKLTASLELGKYIDGASTEIEPFEISSFRKLYLYTFFLEDKFVSNKDIREQLNQSGLLNQQDLWHYIPFNKSATSEAIKKPYHFAFNFEKLDFIRKFKNFMKAEYEIEVEMSQVESKENFAFVSALTRTISVILFTLGLATIVIYLINLLTTHLNSIKRNLGTYKAFGLSDTKLNAIYLKIIVSKLCLGLIIAFALLFLIARSGLVENLLSYLVIRLDKTVSCISIINTWNLWAIILLFAITCLTTFLSIKKILNKSPGDLIYNR